MEINAFIALYEEAKRRHAGEVAAIPYPNPLLAHHTFFSAVDGLRKDWRELAPDKDPGKYKPHRFWARNLVRDNGRVVRCDRFWPREAVDDLRAAEQGFMSNGLVDEIEIPLGSLADAASHPCSSCAAPGPVIGTYMQTRNSIEFDEWQFSLAVLCASCVAARAFHRQSECERFSHRIFAGG